MRSTVPVVAALSVAAALLLGPGAPAVAGATACPQIIAHRTLMAERPENTVPGIQAVPATGADGVEMDVQWSSSSFPVLMHDATVDRTTNGTGAPSTLGLGQLRALSAAAFSPWSTSAYGGFETDGSPVTPVPYGWEFMNAIKTGDIDAVLDIHAAPSALGMDKLTYYIGSAGWVGRTLVMAPAAQVVSMRGWEPTLKYAVIEYPPAGRIYTGEYLVGIGAAAYVVPYTAITAPMVAYYHAYGLMVYAWTSDSATVDVAENWSAVTDAGADALITNKPADARAALCGS